MTSQTNELKPDTVTMPKSLTAENGAKAHMMGEFEFEGRNGSFHVVPWTTIKDIYSEAVDYLGEPTRSPDTDLREAVKAYGEYINFLNNANDGPIKLAYVHGWRCSDEDMAKGEEFRVRINKLLRD